MGSSWFEDETTGPPSWKDKWQLLIHDWESGLDSPCIAKGHFFIRTTGDFLFTGDNFSVLSLQVLQKKNIYNLQISLLISALLKLTSNILLYFVR